MAHKPISITMSLLKPQRRILPPLSLNHLKAPTLSTYSLNKPHILSSSSTTTRTMHHRHHVPQPLLPPHHHHNNPQPRTFTTSPAQLAVAKAQAAEISPEEYHKLADQYIDALVAELEEMQEEREDVDVEYSAGVLTLLYPPHGTYVLNKQPPNKQIWLSSPVSGPKRYDWVVDGTVKGKGGGEWVYLRDGSTLTGLLEEEVGVVGAGGEEE